MGGPSTTNPLLREKRNAQWLWATRVIILVAFLDLFMQFPVIAPYARTLGAPSALVGMVVAVYSITNLAGNLGAGAILDRWGRKRPLLVGLLATALALSGYALSRTPQQLMAARAVHGLAAAMLAPGAFAILGDSARTGGQGRVMGVSGAFIGVAAVIGPFIAGVLRDKLGPGAVFLLSATLMLGTALLFWRLFKESASQDGEQPVGGKTKVGLLALALRLRLVTSYLAALALTIGLGTLVTHLPIVMAERGQSATRTGLAFTVFAVIAMVGMASPLSHLSDRYGRLAPMISGLILVAGGMAALGISMGFSGIALGMGTFGLGFGLLFPAMTALIAEETEWRERGKAFGIFYAVFSIGVVIGSLVSGATQRPGTSPVIPFLFSLAVAVMAVPAIAITWQLGRKKQPSVNPS